MRQIREKISSYLHKNNAIVISPDEKFLFLIENAAFSSPEISLEYEIDDQGCWHFYKENNETVLAKRYEIAHEKDSRATLGWEQNNGKFSYINSVSEEEWQIAEAHLKDQPAGTQLSCYKKIPRPYFDSTQKTPLFLPCDFAIVKKERKESDVFAINPVTKKNIFRNTPDASEIQAVYWEFVEKEFKKNKKLLKIKSNYNVYRDDIPIFHYFLVMNLVTHKDHAGMLQFASLIVAQYRFEKMHGGFSSVMAGVTQDNQAIVIKKIKNERYSFSLKKFVPTEKSFEEALSYKTDLFIGSALLPRFNLFGMQLYQKDLLGFCDLLIKLKRPINEVKKILTKIFLQIVTQLRALHVMHYSHSDLKETNILIDCSNMSSPVAKITDYGLSKKLNDLGQHVGLMAGTEGYFAPELIDEYIATHAFVTFSFSTDWYALGKIFAHIYERFKLGNEYYYRTIQNGLLNKSPAHRLSLDYVQFLLMCDLASLENKSYLQIHVQKSCGITTIPGSRALMKLFELLGENAIESFKENNWIAKIETIEMDMQSQNDNLSRFALSFLNLMPQLLNIINFPEGKKETATRCFQFYLDRNLHGFERSTEHFASIFFESTFYGFHFACFGNYLKMHFHLEKHGIVCENITSFPCFFDKYTREKNWAERFDRDILALLQKTTLNDVEKKEVTDKMDELLPLLEVLDGLSGWVLA